MTCSAAGRSATTRQRWREWSRGLIGACHPVPGIVVTSLVVVFAAGVGVRFGQVVLLGAAVLTGQLSVGWSNDWVDAARDRAVGREDKPVAAGTVSVPAVGLAAAVALTATIVLSLLLGTRPGAALLIGIAAAWAYNLGLKATIWSGTTYLLAFGALPVAPYAALPGQPWPPWWVPVVSALLGFGAHCANVLPDLRADAQTGVRGLPHRLGARVSGVVMAVALAAASVVLGIAPHAMPTAYAVTSASAGIALAVMAAMFAVRFPHSPMAFRLALVIALLDVVLLVAVTNVV
jgi:4-hydroxybenzoate polyprenyltransferase